MKRRLGWLCDKEYRHNEFGFADVVLPYAALCTSHKFVFNWKEEQDKLSKALPCIYTDSRFKTDSLYFPCRIDFKKATRTSNYYKLHDAKNVVWQWGMPKGTQVILNTWWYWKGVNISTNYVMETQLDFQYPEYIIDDVWKTSTCSSVYINNIVTQLREAGFICNLTKVTNFATVYGHGLRVHVDEELDELRYEIEENYNKLNDCHSLEKLSETENFVEVLLNFAKINS